MQQEDEIAFSDSPAAPPAPNDWREALQVSDGVGATYLELYGVMHSQWCTHFHSLNPHRSSDGMTVEEHHEWIEKKAHDQCDRSENMLWFGVWKAIHDDMKPVHGLPTTQREFCKQWLQCDTSLIAKWRKKHRWFFVYLKSMSHVGKKILTAAQDPHYRMIASEGMRPDAVGLQNRIQAAKIRGDYDNPLDNASGGGGVIIMMPDNDRGNDSN